MSFVKTPFGVVMHAENHRKAVEAARRHKLKGMLLMLEPAEPLVVEHATDVLDGRRTEEAGGGDPPQRPAQQEPKP